VSNRRTKATEARRLADVAMQRMRERAKQSRAEETDPVEAAAYALIERLGWDWFDTESSARAVARAAARDILALRKELEELRQGGFRVRTQLTNTKGE